MTRRGTSEYDDDLWVNFSLQNKDIITTNNENSAQIKFEM